MSWRMLAHGNLSMITIMCSIHNCNISYRIVMSFETVTATYTEQIPVNENITFSNPFVTVTAENVSEYYTHDMECYSLSLLRTYLVTDSCCRTSNNWKESGIS